VVIENFGYFDREISPEFAITEEIKKYTPIRKRQLPGFKRDESTQMVSL
jgi:hypothetical protein